MRARTLLVFLLLLGAPSRAAQALQGCGSTTGKLPLIDLGTGSYKGFEGGLYPGGANTPPAGHLQAALAEAASVVPRDAAGDPDPGCGLIVLLSIGMSNTAHKFGRFERLEDANPARNPRLVLVNGAQGGQSAENLLDPGGSYWTLVDARLGALGLTPEQVQVVWMEEALQSPPDDFPLHALELQSALEIIAQNLRARFPNLRLCYLSDRTYGGYANGLSPEPQAYETGFADKWLIEDQIEGQPQLNWNPDAGPVVAPLLLWGPYLWADGETPNGVGTRWCACDFENCANAHPSASGEQKVAELLSGFFASDPTTQAWFPAPGGTSYVTIEAEADAHVDAAAPGSNFGSAAGLLTAGGAAPARAYLRFDLSGLKRPVLHAKLSFRNPEDPLTGADREVLVAADDAWDEAAITYASAPAPGASLGVIPPASRDGTRSLDVTAEVNGHGDPLLTLVLAGVGGTGPATLVISREGGQAPRLVVITEPGGPVGYCTAGTSASGCAAAIGTKGLPSASAPSGFLLRASQVEGQKIGLFFYGPNGRQANPWGNGGSYQCVVPPVFRGGAMPGAGTLGACDGTFQLDLNARWCPTCPRPGQNPGAGTAVQAQLWYRDPGSTSNQTTSLSDAVEFHVCP